MSHNMDVPVPVRLCLRPADARAGPVLDGAWWPRTHEPARELRSLLPLVRRWRGHLRVVSLSVAGCHNRPRHVVVDGQPVPLHWLGLYRDLLIASCLDHQQVRRLVIPPDNGQAVADTAMSTALDPDDHASPPLILARAAVGPLTTRSAPGIGPVGPVVQHRPPAMLAEPGVRDRPGAGWQT